MSVVYFHTARHGRVEQAVAVEYQRQKVGRKFHLLPFSVFTIDASKTPKDEPKEAWMAGLYDFNWCRRDEQLYYHCSGGGGRFYLHPLAKGGSSKVWWDKALVHPTHGGKTDNVFLSDRTVRRWGYTILPEPLGNPFSAASESEVVYCSRCRDHLPSSDTEHPCEHIHWCDNCGDWSTPDDRCDCARNGGFSVTKTGVYYDGCAFTNSEVREALEFVFKYRHYKGTAPPYRLHGYAVTRDGSGVAVGCTTFPWRVLVKLRKQLKGVMEVAL